MSAILQNGFSGIEYPLNHPRIGWRSVGGTVTTSGSAAGYPAANALDPRTALGWKPDAATGIIGIDAGASVPASYCGVAGHDLGSKNATVRLQRLSGATWVNIFGSTDIADDSALLFLFAPVDAAQFRLRIDSADAAPRIGHIRFGQVTEIPRLAGYGGTVPISESRQFQYDTLQSNGGAFLGRSIVATSLQFQVSVQHTSETWRKTEWRALQSHANTGGATFFVADRPSTDPEDVAYAWSNEALSAGRGISNRPVAIDFVLNCEAL